MLCTALCAFVFSYLRVFELFFFFVLMNRAATFRTSVWHLFLKLPSSTIIIVALRALLNGLHTTAEWSATVLRLKHARSYMLTHTETRELD